MAGKVRQPVGVVAVSEKIAKWPHQESLRRESHHFGKTLRDKDQPALGVGLPDPICARLGDITKARLARLDRPRCLAGMVQNEPRGSCNEAKREQKRRHEVPDQLLPERRWLPRQTAQLGAVGRGKGRDGGGRLGQ